MNVSELVRKEIESFRSLAGYCSHDLRGEIARALSSLALSKDFAEGDPAARLELIQIAEFSLQTALQDLDRKLEQHATDVEHVWIYVRNGRAGTDFSGLEGNFLLQTFSDRQSLLDKRQQYRPDYLVCDVQGLENPQEIVDLVDRMGSGLVQIILLGSAREQEKYGPLLSPVRCQWLLVDEGSDPAVLIKNNFANAR